MLFIVLFTLNTFLTFSLLLSIFPGNITLDSRLLSLHWQFQFSFNSITQPDCVHPVSTFQLHYHTVRWNKKTLFNSWMMRKDDNEESVKRIKQWKVMTLTMQINILPFFCIHLLVVALICKKQNDNHYDEFTLQIPIMAWNAVLYLSTIMRRLGNTFFEQTYKMRCCRLNTG